MEEDWEMAFVQLCPTSDLAAFIRAPVPTYVNGEK